MVSFDSLQKWRNDPKQYKSHSKLFRPEFIPKWTNKNTGSEVYQGTMSIHMKLEMKTYHYLFKLKRSISSTAGKTDSKWYNGFV